MRSRTLREGSVGLLILLFLVACGGIFLWLRGVRLGQSSYNIVVEFDNANSLKPGATVRYRGIDIGKVKELKPTSNGVDVTIEVEEVDLRIPKNVDINVNQAGLVGESSVDINPQTSLNQDSLAFSAISDDCNSQLIICENDRLPGSSGASFQELISGTVSLTSKLNDPRFFGNLSLAAENAAVAADRVSELSLELKLLSKSVQQEIKGLSATGESVTAIANTTSRQINSTGEQLNQTAAQFSQLANNVNSLVSDVNSIVAENRGTLVATLDEISNTSQELRILVNNLNPVVSKVNSSLDNFNTEQLVQNLETMTANASAASANFKDLSEGLNNPTNVLLLQQTLDSARATFENAQKITADLDELTGDPRFRQNLLDLVNGLSNLVSHTEQLEKVVLRSEVIETVQLESQNLQIIPSNSNTYFPQGTSQEPQPPFASLRVKRSK